LKVAFALENPLRYGGGVSILVATLIEACLPEHEVMLISPDDGVALAQDPLGAKLQKHIRWDCAKNPPSQQFSTASRNALRELVGERPDLVHFHSGGLFSWGNRWPGSSWPAALRRQGIPSVWTNHLVVDWLHGYCGDRKPLWFKLAMLPLSYLGKSQQLAATSAEICVSDHDAGKIRRWYFPFSKKVKRIYHSRLAEHEIAFSPLPREKMILAVGHLAFRKGQHILVQAFAKICREHSDWKLVLIGPESADGCAGWIRSFCRKEGIEAQVELAGPRSHPSDWMKRCSIFVQPSLQEALGLALQEAMATGCACIGTKVGGIPELIEDDRSGLLCEGGEVSQLAQALVKFMEQKELRGRCGKAALDRVRALKMNQGVMIQAHREIYAQYGAC
jgi:glycosyltransferase involved in cell wall biosynthesis